MCWIFRHDSLSVCFSICTIPRQVMPGNSVSLPPFPWSNAPCFISSLLARHLPSSSTLSSSALVRRQYNFASYHLFPFPSLSTLYLISTKQSPHLALMYASIFPITPIMTVAVTTHECMYLSSFARSLKPGSRSCKHSLYLVDWFGLYLCPNVTLKVPLPIMS